MIVFIVQAQNKLHRVYGDYYEVSPNGNLWIKTTGDPAKDVVFNQFYWQKVNRA